MSRKVVAVALCMAVGVVRVVHASSQQEIPKKFPEPVAIAEHDLEFFRKGQHAALSDEEIRTMVKDYQAALTEAYSTMSAELAPLLIKPKLSDEDIVRYSSSTSHAADRIVAATRKLLRPFDFSDGEAARLIPKYYFFNGAQKALMQAVMGGERISLLDEISMPRSVPFTYFMAGLSRRIGIYIYTAADDRTVGARLKVHFPIYYFEEATTEREIGLPDMVDRFLRLAEADHLAGAFYDRSINAFHVVAVPSSIELSLDGVAPYHARYGLNDTMEPTLKIILFEGNIQHRVRRLPKAWGKDFLAGVQIHEIMHALHRHRRQSCLALPDSERKLVKFESTPVNFYDLDEAQAQVATIAALANDGDPSLNSVLALNLDLSHGHKIEEIFYQRLFERVRSRQRLQDAYAKSKDVPELDAQYGLLLDAEAKEVFDVAALMLKKIADSEALLCD